MRGSEHKPEPADEVQLHMKYVLGDTQQRGSGRLIAWASTARQLWHETVCLKYRREFSLCAIYFNAQRRGRN